MKRSNPSALKELQEKLQALDGVEGKVGWFEDAQYENGTPVAFVASAQEFGAGPTPPRPFMRSTAEEEKQSWSNVADGVSKKVIKGELSPESGMELITMRAEGDVAKKISTITSPPLSPITLGARKYRMMGKKVTGATIGEIAGKLKRGELDLSGVSTKPLVDTAHMVSTLTHKVEKS